MPLKLALCWSWGVSRQSIGITDTRSFKPLTQVSTLWLISIMGSAVAVEIGAAVLPGDDRSRPIIIVSCQAVAAKSELYAD